MPAKSKAQQRFFGMVDAYKKGDLKNASKEVKDAAKGMTKKEVKKFASTKRKGLPEKVKESIIRLTEQDLHTIVRNVAMRVIREGFGEVEQETTYNRPPKSNEPVFIECSSKDDADMEVWIHYSPYDCTKFFVGGCGTDANAAIEAILDWAEKNGLVENYFYTEEDMDGYSEEDFIYVDKGYYLPSWLVQAKQIVGNHGERRH